MTFNEADVVRDQSGRFGEKHGAPSEVSLHSPFPEGFPTEGTMQEKVDWALENDAALTVNVGDISGDNELSGEHLQQTWKMAEQFHVDFEISAARLPEPFSQEIGRVATRLQSEALDEEGVTLTDIARLRASVNRAEYRLTEYEVEDYLEKNHPEVRALVISFDAFSGDPYVAGVETTLPDAGSAQNYGDITPISNGYEDILSSGVVDETALSRFENEGLFDEYGTVLINEDSKWAEFSDPTGGELGLADSARVYRFGERY